jgi:hypothetical protein
MKERENLAPKKETVRRLMQAAEVLVDGNVTEFPYKLCNYFSHFFKK